MILNLYLNLNNFAVNLHSWTLKLKRIWKIIRFSSVFIALFSIALIDYRLIKYALENDQSIVRLHWALNEYPGFVCPLAAAGCCWTGSTAVMLKPPPLILRLYQTRDYTCNMSSFSLNMRTTETLLDLTVPSVCYSFKDSGKLTTADPALYLHSAVIQWIS